MTAAIRIWACAAYLPVYRCGGWAYVRSIQDQVTGAAGGERHTTARRVALAGLIAALRELPPSDPVEIRTTSPELGELAGVLASLNAPAGADAPDDDLDLWARIIAATKDRRLALTQTAVDLAAPTAFAAAWADLARDKAKATGAFTAAIPRTNLAKVRGLDQGR